MKVIIINGPNLNLLGVREKSIYGEKSFDAYYKELCAKFSSINFSYYQSNIEGEIINFLHENGFEADAIILNAGGYTHTSVALRDCIAATEVPVIEVHLSNVASRESFRHESLITPVSKGCIMGFGLESYELAMYYFLNR